MIMRAYILASIFLVGFVSAQWDPHFVPGRHTMVHLFEWTWNDIALECERFLAPYGYGGVQVSPVNENRVFIQDGIVRPWFERYQPVSYSLDSTRSGNEAEFISMVARCNAVGVRIYVDAIINHMTGGGGAGVGTGGSSYNYDLLEYPAVPYSGLDFNGPHNCFTASGNIENYGPGSEDEVRNCRLSSTTDELSDLNPGNGWVDVKILEFLNKLIGFGVAGFRLDAAKHMWPNHIQSIVDRLDDLSTAHGFEAGLRPFIVQEVIDLGGEAVSNTEYLGIGRITEFRWGVELGRTLRKEDGRKLSEFGGDFIPDLSALSFIDNHDNQRGHGAGGESIISHKEFRLYKVAQAFSLANVYGIARVMSSFTWELDWYGPPHDADYNTLPVIVNEDLSCNVEWVCEHRWRQIYNMVRFRNVAYGELLSEWWDNDNNQIAFSRGSKAFIAINNDDYEMNARITTLLPVGSYCDIITGNLDENGNCTGRVVEVNSDGTIQVEISNTAEDPILAIHVEARLQ